MAEIIVTDNAPEVVIESDAVTTEHEEDDYKWLTERLDAHTRDLTETRTQFQTALEAMREANQNNLSESRTLIQSLTEIVTSANQTLTGLAASALLQSTRSNSATTSQVATEAAIVENPESVAEENQAQRTEPEKRRRRIL